MNRKTISADYREKNHRLHITNPNYGSGGAKWSTLIRKAACKFEIQTILDYGCGKQGLAKALRAHGLHIYEYDPGIPGLDKIPCPQVELVVCTDVLEHVEPDFIHAVLEEIADLTTRFAFFNVATRPAIKNLEDGRNAHLIIESFSWWHEIISQNFDILAQKIEEDYDFSVFLTKKNNGHIFNKFSFASISDVSIV